MNASGRARPIGVTLLASLCLLYAVVLLGLAVVAFKHPEVLERLQLVNSAKSPSHRKLDAGYFIGLAPLSAGLAMIIGIGLMFQRSWARWAILILVGLSLARQVSLLAGIGIVAGKNFTLTPAFAISIFIDAAVVYYLTRPAIKACFGEGTDSRIYSS